MRRLLRAILYVCILFPLACTAGPCATQGGVSSGSVAVVLPSAGEVFLERGLVAEGEFLGLVQGGRFLPLVPGPDLESPVRLTSIQMQEAVSPESGELDLSRYEGRAIMVRGHDGGGWIYAAEVIDEAGPILTAVVREVFAGSQLGD
jgi:hypothetical protein